MERVASALNPETILKASGNPDLAAHQWNLIAPLLPPPLPAASSAGMRALLSLLGNSRFLVEHLLSQDDPHRSLAHLVHSPFLTRPKPHSGMMEELGSLFGSEFHGTAASAQRVIRRYKYPEMARIAARDLSGLAPFEEIGHELSDLASVCGEFSLRAALELLHDRWQGPKDKIPPFTIMALGKMGGEDLNFSSDIDIVFVYRQPEWASDKAREIFEFFCQVAELVTRILQERTPDGIGFRVDLDLRPEGRSGVIVNSVEAMATYYEIAGAPWERAALIKAKPVAGNGPLGLDLIVQLAPFVYPKHIDSSAISDLKKMKEKIDAKFKKNSRSQGFHVKLGSGGIREIEFFASAFQLIYGGKEPALRERNTLKVLSVLKKLQLAPAEDLDRLARAYVFLRRIENRLQMEEERQIHTLPTDPAEIARLARRTGYPDAGAFLKDLKEQTAFVSSCFERLAS